MTSMSALGVIFSIMMLVWQILLTVGLAKWFGRSGWFAIGLFLFPIIFVAIIAFSCKTHYIFGYYS